MNENSFWLYVKKTRGCWHWLGAKRNGYGRLNYNGKWLSAHRFAYELIVGSIPKGLYLLHSCDNPGCVNTEHLTPGTQLDNMNDMYRKNRRPSKQFCSKGHDTSIVGRISSGGCKKCNSEAALAYYYKRRDLSRTSL